jgi:hypothetical protein
MLDITARLSSVVGGQPAHQHDVDSIAAGFREIAATLQRACTDPYSRRCKNAKAYVAWYGERFHF